MEKNPDIKNRLFNDRIFPVPSLFVIDRGSTVYGIGTWLTKRNQKKLTDGQTFVRSFMFNS